MIITTMDKELTIKTIRENMETTIKTIKISMETTKTIKTITIEKITKINMARL
jgi:hypothetical protein